MTERERFGVRAPGGRGGATASSTTPEELYERLARGDPLTILDTRNRDEFEAWHVDGPGIRAVQVPHVEFIRAEVTGDVDELVGEHDLAGPIVAICARGEASDHAAALLREVGLDAVNLAGGMDAWARTYVVTGDVGAGSDADVVAGADTGESAVDLAVRQYLRPSSDCLSYLVHGGGQALVVDPLRAFADRYVEDAAELGVEVVGVVDTHVHADHLSGLREVAALAGAAAYLPAGAAERGLAFDAELLSGGDGIAVGDGTIEAVHVPGHTTEMTALRAGDVLLSGDSLFVESVARPDLEAGDAGAPELAAQLHESLHERVLALPDETTVAPGHVGPRTPPDEDGTYAARLGDLRDRLDLLGLDREAFVSRVGADMPPQPANYERIIEANLGRTVVGDEEGFELELGPNNCAVSA